MEVKFSWSTRGLSTSHFGKVTSIKQYRYQQRQGRPQ